MRPADLRRCHPPSGASAGFTLVEMLIALAMVSLIMVLLYAGLRVGGRTWDLVDVTAERAGAVRLAHGFLLRTLTQSRPVSLVFDGGTSQVFAGDRERLEFAAPLSEHVGVPGIYVLRLAVEGDGAKRALVLTRWLIHPEILEGKAEGVPEWKPLKEDSQGDLGGIPLDQDLAAGAFGRTLLLEGVAEIVFSYFGVVTGDSEPDWHKEWLEQPAPPALVRIHIKTIDQTWPDLIVALPAIRS